MKFYSHGKLLITGEYFVLDGAMALAVPTRFGQSLEVEKIPEQLIIWESRDYKGDIWFNCEIPFEEITGAGPSIYEHKQKEIYSGILNILRKANSLNPEILDQKNGLRITTTLDFPQNWGLGSSSTLINNMADWFNIEPFELLKATFGGSGYDIAAGRASQPITYQLTDSGSTSFSVNFDPPFKNELFFVHLNKKQNSRTSIAHYRERPQDLINECLEKISSLTGSFIMCENLEEFELLMDIHETVVSTFMDLPKIKSEFFPDYHGFIKSLGGWGGDFILATGKEPEMDYFRAKGYSTILPFREMVL